MTLRAVVACAALLAIGCGKKEDAVAVAPDPPIVIAPETPERDGGAPSGPGAPGAPAQGRDRCRTAIEHALTVSTQSKVVTDMLADGLVEQCRTEGWSSEQLACLERATDEKVMQTCQPAAPEHERLRARLLSIMRTDASAPSGGAPPPERAAGSALRPLEARLHLYAKLLAIDVSLFQLVESYPGAPKGTTFETGEYQWRRHGWIPLDEMQQDLGAVLASISTGPGLPSAPALRAYAERAAAWIPRLIALAAYYDDKKFVDDEFDHGRAEAADLRRTAAELAKPRGPMRGAVFAAWRELVAPYAHSPRAIASHAWMACMSIADRVMEKASPESIAAAVSECRRSIPRLAESGESSGFDANLRDVAGELGDWVAQGYPSWRTNVSDALGRLTLHYLALWPKLSTSPAEKPAP